ncbi:DUF397 domain-containing protein [Streptomyces longwoodensis]
MTLTRSTGFVRGGGGNNCVEVAVNDENDDVAIRNSTRPEQVIRTSRTAFTALVAQLRRSTQS